MRLRILAACLVLALAGCTDDVDPEDDASPRGPMTHDVTIEGFAFTPKTLDLQAGDTVRWTNKDSATHTVSGFEDVWLSGDLAQGETFSHVFSEAGLFDYRCDYHPSMNGRITVS